MVSYSVFTLYLTNTKKRSFFIVFKDKNFHFCKFIFYVWVYLLRVLVPCLLSLILKKVLTNTNLTCIMNMKKSL